jgi:streptogramin lyase
MYYREQTGITRSTRRWLWMMLAVVMGLALTAGVSRALNATASTTGPAPALPSQPLVASAYLYRLDPESGAFVTITLPVDSRPAAVSVVSGLTSQLVWFTEPGLGRVGLVVYTSSLDYTLTEFPVRGNPTDLIASNTDVWFTLPPQNQIGRLSVADGNLAVYDLPSPGADAADIAMDSGGNIWVMERAANRLAYIATTPTVTITEYALPAAGLGPEGVLPGEDNRVWFAASAAGQLWQLAPGIGEQPTTVPVGPTSYPFRLATDQSNQIWATLNRTNQLAVIGSGSLTITYYTIPTPDSQPTAISVDASNRVYFIESLGRIGRLVTTPTVAFAEYQLPRSGLGLTGLAVAENGSVWTVAHYVVHRLYMPVVYRDYDNGFSPFAVQMYGNIQATTSLTRAFEAGVRSVRFQVFWFGIEPTNTTPANYNWANLDATVQTATRADIQLILTIEGNPSWAAATWRGPVTNTADLQEFMGAIVARYPQVKYWELYNEPDYINGFGFKGATYAATLRDVYPAIKAANPNAQLVMGGLALDWFTENGGLFDRHFLDDVLSNCSGPCFDVANFHYYAWFRPDWEPYGRDILGKANYVRQTLAAHGYDRPIMNTETGWPSAAGWGSPELQARYVPKVFIRSRAAGLLMANWYAWIDSDSSNPGLVGPGDTPRPAYTAYQTLASVMRSTRFVRTISPSETGFANLEGYQFANQSGSKRLDIYWYDCPSLYAWGDAGGPTDCADTVPLQISAPRVAVIDTLGDQALLLDAEDGLADGKVTIPGGVGSSPIYVDYSP